MASYSGIKSFRLKLFGADKSLNGQINFGEVSDTEMVALNKLNKEGEVGVILMSADMLEDFQQLINQAQDVNEENESN